MNDSDRYAYECDRPLVEFLDAVDTIAQFIGGEEGERVRKALLSLGNCPEPVPAEQHRINFDGNSIPF